MSQYIDGFVFPIPKKHLKEYQNVAFKVAEVWKEYGALSYQEYLGNDLTFEGIRSFQKAVDASEDEVVIFGWVSFPSKEVRDQANEQVPNDPRMEKLVGPLTEPKRMVFNAERMIYGGFEALVRSAD